MGEQKKMRTTLIINCSPRVNGDSAALIAELRKHLHGDVIELSAFRSNIAPCVDCRLCQNNGVCAVKDDMDIIYGEEYDNVVLATPIYFSMLPGAALSLISRFQPLHAARRLGLPFMSKIKKAGLILVAGGSGNEGGAERSIGLFFRMFNAIGYDEHRVVSLITDTLPAKDDKAALATTRDLALWLNTD